MVIFNYKANNYDIFNIVKKTVIVLIYFIQNFLINTVNLKKCIVI